MMSGIETINVLPVESMYHELMCVICLLTGCSDWFRCL